MLLVGLAEKGFGREQLAEMQTIIDAEKSDLFDVLAYVAYSSPPVNREERAARARLAISKEFNTRQEAFLDFVLAHYVSVGVEELDQEKQRQWSGTWLQECRSEAGESRATHMQVKLVVENSLT